MSPKFVKLCFSPTLEGSTKIEGRTTMMIKVISRMFKSNAPHPGKEQTKRVYIKPGAAHARWKGKWLTSSTNRKAREEVVKLSA